MYEGKQMSMSLGQLSDLIQENAGSRWLSKFELAFNVGKKKPNTKGFWSLEEIDCIILLQSTLLAPR